MPLVEKNVFLCSPTIINIEKKKELSEFDSININLNNHEVTTHELRRKKNASINNKIWAFNRCQQVVSAHRLIKH